MAAESRHVEIVFDDLVRLLETGFDITRLAWNRNIAFGGGFLGALPVDPPFRLLRIRPDDRGVRLSSFQYVDDVRTNCPIAD